MLSTNLLPYFLIHSWTEHWTTADFYSTDTWRYSFEQEAKGKDEATKQIPTPILHILLSPNFPPW